MNFIDSDENTCKLCKHNKEGGGCILKCPAMVIMLKSDYKKLMKVIRAVKNRDLYAIGKALQKLEGK